jgi:hypothetical protein
MQIMVANVHEAVAPSRTLRNPSRRYRSTATEWKSFVALPPPITLASLSAPLCDDHGPSQRSPCNYSTRFLSIFKTAVRLERTQSPAAGGVPVVWRTQPSILTRRLSY